MDPITMKRLGQEHLEQLRREAAAASAVSRIRPASPYRERRIRHAVGVALIRAGQRLAGERAP